MKKTIALLMAASVITGVCAQSEWLHIFLKNNKINTSEIADFESLEYLQKLSEEPEETPEASLMEESSEGEDSSAADSQANIVYDRMAVTRAGVTEEFAIEDVESIVVGTNVPTIRIDVEDGKDIVSKVTYKNARISISGYGEYDDFDQEDVQIRGRGNSSWGNPKKPYRLKFNKKKSLCGLKKAKSYVLLANQMDWTLMRNVVAMKIGRLIEMPYTNHMIPVNLILNGKFRGAYALSEKVGFNSGSVHDIDETKGVLFEIDTYYDEDYKFKSARYNLPVMLKDPDPVEILEDDESGRTPEDFLAEWRADFEEMENAVYLSSIATETPTDPDTPTNPDTPTDPVTPTDPELPSEPDTPTDPVTPTDPELPSEPDTPELGDGVENSAGEIDSSNDSSEGDYDLGQDSGDESEARPDIAELIDFESLAKYLLVFNVCGNHEIAYPKSCYLYKADKDAKYQMGPLWDFDWAFNFPIWESNNTEVYSTDYLFSEDFDDRMGSKFFIAIMKDERAMKEYAKQWARFRDELLPELYEYMDQYLAKIHVSALQNAEIWEEQRLGDVIAYDTSDIYNHVAALKKWLENRVAFLDSAVNFGLFYTDEPVLTPSDPENPGEGGDSSDKGDGGEEDGEEDGGKESEKD